MQLQLTGCGGEALSEAVVAVVMATAADPAHAPPIFICVEATKEEGGRGENASAQLPPAHLLRLRLFIFPLLLQRNLRAAPACLSIHPF